MMRKRYFLAFPLYIVSILNLQGATLCDAPRAWQMLFQDPATPTMEGIINFHHDVMFFIFGIIGLVCWMLFRSVYLFERSRNPVAAKFIHGKTIEIIWTVLPTLILVFIAIPSFALLYSMDEVVDPSITIKATGHQWYWSYQYDDLQITETINETPVKAILSGIEFESYMLPEDSLTVGLLRLLEVDNRVVMPIKTHIRLIVTAADVIHSWCVPSLAIKLDGCPGRINQTTLFIKRPGVYYGQCSEICGVNHAFMPIVVDAVEADDYISWVLGVNQPK